MFILVELVNIEWEYTGGFTIHAIAVVLSRDITFYAEIIMYNNDCYYSIEIYCWY